MLQDRLNGLAMCGIMNDKILHQEVLEEVS
jgi:hypothetical protein